MKYIMLLPMLLACGDKEEEDTSADEVEAVEEEAEDTSSETAE